MKKFNVFVLAALFGLISAKAEVLLTDNFEGLTDIVHNGWTVINGGADTDQDNWTLTTEKSAMDGKASAVAGGFKDYKKKENLLITPELTLADQSYKLQFLWGDASAAYAIEQKQYDFQIRVQVAGETTWTPIFSFLNKEQVELSGVKFPWKNWEQYQSLIDLTAFKGKTIKIAFVYMKLKDGYSGNTIKVDNVLVESYEQITTPVIESVTKSYLFPTTYLGTESHSEVLTFKNVGVGTLEVKGISGLEGSDFTTSIVPGTVFVEKNNEYAFNIHYKPTLVGKTDATMVIETNGKNNLEIKLTGKKEMIPDGYTYEGFEGAFPPVGWTKTGMGWLSRNASYSGQHCAWGTAAMEEKAELTSPRLDLSENKEHTIIFDFYEDYQQVVSPYPEPDNYFRVYMSKDGGNSWTKIYENSIFNERVRKTLSLGNPQSDNCYVKWEYYVGDFMNTYDDTEYSNVYLDDVLLPYVYGQNDKPAAAMAVSPTDGAVNVMNRDLTLSWEAVQFADSYKVFLGTAPDNFEVMDGVNVGNNLSSAAPRLDYNKTYFWKVVAVNAKGETANAPVWSFTTMEDQTVSEYPYFQGFEGSGTPMGWQIIKDKYTKWNIAEMSPFDGKKVAIATGSQDNTTAQLVSSEFALPGDKPAQISFFWGNDVAVALKKDDFGIASNTTTAPDGKDAVYFDINVDGEWRNKAILSQDCEYWLRECIDLSEYKGKTVAFRWRYSITKAMASRGASLDNIKVESATDCAAYFNTEVWNAGEVNYQSSVTAKDKYSMTNGGITALEIQSVSFTTDNFTTTMAAGTKIEPNKVCRFDITFNALNTVGTRTDKMTVTFTNGQTAELPLAATVLAADIAFYNFEDDEFGSVKPQGFTVIDEDRTQTYGSSAINFPNEGSAFAYVVINVTPENADWRNVYPRSGDQVLAAFATPTTTASDWIISPMMKATDKSQFRFFGKSYATDDEFNDFTPHYYRVLVSTTDTKPSSFEEVQYKTELDYSKEGAFTEYTTDLSAYAGQNIYVALHHSASTTGYVAFFDDFYYEHFDFGKGGVENINEKSARIIGGNGEIIITGSNEEVAVYTVSGAMIACGANRITVPAGMYIAVLNGKATKVAVR